MNDAARPEEVPPDGTKLACPPGPDGVNPAPK